jgi:hypothetical protein
MKLNVAAPQMSYNKGAVSSRSPSEFSRDRDIGLCAVFFPAIANGEGDINSWLVEQVDDSSCWPSSF